MRRVLVLIAVVPGILFAIGGCSTITPLIDPSLSTSCVDEDAPNPTETQVFEGVRDAMINGKTDQEEIDGLRRALDPAAQMQRMREIGTGTLPSIAAVLAEMPTGGYRAYVRAVCSKEKEWDKPLDHSRVRWALAWDGIGTCQIIGDRPADQRDEFVEAQAKAPALVGTEIEWLIEYGEVKTRAARQYLCPN